nr:hypothetical protein [Nitrosomonas nitrosa]
MSEALLNDTRAKRASRKAAADLDFRAVARAAVLVQWRNEQQVRVPKCDVLWRNMSRDWVQTGAKWRVLGVHPCQSGGKQGFDRVHTPSLDLSLALVQ